MRSRVTEFPSLTAYRAVARGDMALEQFASLTAEEFAPKTTVPTIDELVDEYRVKLGLRPWTELGHGRRSGRTTHMMLIAIATVVTTGKRVVVSFDEACIELSKRDLLVTARLFGVDKSMFEVVPHHRAERAAHTLREKLVVFSDHYDSRYRFSSR